MKHSCMYYKWVGNRPMKPVNIILQNFLSFGTRKTKTGCYYFYIVQIIHNPCFSEGRFINHYNHYKFKKKLNKS